MASENNMIASCCCCDQDRFINEMITIDKIDKRICKQCAKFAIKHLAKLIQRRNEK